MKADELDAERELRIRFQETASIFELTRDESSNDDDSIVEATIVSDQIDESALGLLGALPFLEILRIECTSASSGTLTENALFPLARLRKLRQLTLAGEPFTEQLLAPLQFLRALERLSFNGRDFVQAGLPQAFVLPTLENLFSGSIPEHKKIRLVTRAVFYSVHHNEETDKFDSVEQGVVELNDKGEAVWTSGSPKFRNEYGGDCFGIPMKDGRNWLTGTQSRYSRNTYFYVVVE